MATLCLLITYHWHGSSAVSTWRPSGWAGIVAEVNGSPTDAPVNIPVVKRSSNQANLANELPWRPDVGGSGDRHEVEEEKRLVGRIEGLVGNGDEVEYRAGCLFQVMQEEYANPAIEKHPAMMHAPETEIIMIGPTAGPAKILLTTSKMMVRYGKWKSKEEFGKKKKAEAKERLKGEMSSLIRSKHYDAVARVIGEINPSTMIAPGNFKPGVSGIECAQTLAGASERRERGRVSAVNAVAGQRLKSKREKSFLTGDETLSDEFSKDRVGDIGGTVLSRHKRKALTFQRIDADGVKTRKWREANGKRNDSDASRLPNRSSSYSSSSSSSSGSSVSPPRSVRPLTIQETKNKPRISRSGITNSVDSGKLRNSWMLHQQSRNTKPRTIVQHLRGNFKRQTLLSENSGRSVGMNEFYATQAREGTVLRHPKKLIGSDERNRRQSGRYLNSIKSQGYHNHLRFIPSYSYASKSSGNRDNLNGIVPLPHTGELAPRNIANFPSFNEGQIENLTKSLAGVFDRQFLAVKQRDDLPNVRTILPKQIFITAPKVIYDTKILPAPFDVPFPDFGGNGAPDNRIETKDAALAISGVFDTKEMELSLNARTAIPVVENSQESDRSSKNFVTPVPPHTVQVSLRVNQPEEVPPVSSSHPVRVYEVRGTDEMKNPTGVQGSFQRDGDEPPPPLNHKSPSEQGAKDHSSDVRSSYDNSASTYTSQDESGSRYVDHSAVIGAADDEYANHQTTTRYADISNIESPERIPMLQTIVRQRDENYDRGTHKWRGQYDNDHVRYAAKYAFGYRVTDDNTQNDFGHQEMRNEGITKGRYHVKLPDGRVQKVDYRVDDGGYHAIVSYQIDAVQ